MAKKEKQKFKIGEMVETKKGCLLGHIAGKLVGWMEYELKLGWRIALIETKPGLFEELHQNYLKKVKK